MQGGSHVLEGGREHARTQAGLRGVANGVNQAVEATQALLNFGDRLGDLLGVRDVEFNNLTHVAEFGQLAGRTRR